MGYRSSGGRRAGCVHSIDLDSLTPPLRIGGEGQGLRLAAFGRPIPQEAQDRRPRKSAPVGLHGPAGVGPRHWLRREFSRLQGSLTRTARPTTGRSCLGFGPTEPSELFAKSCQFHIALDNAAPAVRVPELHTDAHAHRACSRVARRASRTPSAGWWRHGSGGAGSDSHRFGVPISKFIRFQAKLTELVFPGASQLSSPNGV